jgi:hypothetical protein
MGELVYLALEQIVMMARPHSKQGIVTSKGSITVRCRHRASVLVRSCGVVIAAATALALAPASTYGAANNPVTGSTPSHTLVAYTMQGLGSTSLTVSTDARAQVTSGGGRHVTRFHIHVALWKKLKATLRRTDLHAFAGGHCPPKPYPDALIYAITARHETVCTTEGRIPHKLKPLMKILAEIVSVGERRIGNSA